MPAAIMLWCIAAVFVFLVIVLVISGISDGATRKKRLAELPGEIPTALAKARASTEACVEMKRAAILAERAFSAAGLGARKWRFSDGPTEKELLGKTKAASVKALDELKRLSIEGIRLKPSSEYSKLRTAAILSCIACEACSQSLEQQACPAAMILEKIELT